MIGKCSGPNAAFSKRLMSMAHRSGEDVIYRRPTPQPCDGFFLCRLVHVSVFPKEGLIGRVLDLRRVGGVEQKVRGDAEGGGDFEDLVR